MADRYTRALPGGLLVPERIKASALEPIGAGGVGTTDSSYTQTGPRPGLPVPADPVGRLMLEISHAQEEEMSFQVINAGFPARDGVQVAMRRQSEANTAYRGWDGPQLATGWAPINWGSGSVEFNIATVPSNQKLIGGYGNGDSFTVDILEGVTLNTSTGITSGGSDWNDPAFVVLPGSVERTLFFLGGKAWFSDDDGVTWALYSDFITTEDITDYGRTTVGIYRSDIVMLVESVATPNLVYHLVSTDLGATFRLVTSYTGWGSSLNLITNEDGIHIASHLVGSNISHYRRLGTVFEELDAVAQTVVASGAAHDRATLTADGGGTIYFLSGGSEAWVYESRDAGNSFMISASSGIRWGDVNDALINWRAAWQAGRMALMAGFSNNGTPAANTQGIIWFGGWGNVPIYTSDTDSKLSLNRWGYGVRVGSTAADGETWWPWTLPTGQGWTGAGAGTETLTGGHLSLDTTANTRTYTINHSLDVVLVKARIYPETGGSLTTNDIAINVRIADGVDDYDATVRFTTTDMRIYDNNAGAALATVTLPTTGDYLDIRIWMDQGNIKVASRDVGETLWQQDVNTTLTNDNATPQANGQIQWGHIATATATSRWREFHYCGANSNTPQMSFARTDTVGKSLNARREPVPLIGGSTLVAFLAAVSGPGREGDTLTVDPFYEHGIEAAHCEISPSPAATWRSTSTAEQRIVYDLGDEGWTGHGLSLFVANANFKTIILESWNGASWDTEGTLDLSTGFQSLSYSLTGDMMYPDLSGTTAGARWLWEQELRNGWVQAISAGTTATSRIVAQSQGGWQDTAAGTTVVPMLQLEDPAAIAALDPGGTVNLIWNTGLMVLYPSAIANTMARYWRVRIPLGVAEQDTPRGETYYEAGIIKVARIQPFGAEVEWGMRDTGQLNVDSRRDSFGTDRTRERGPQRNDWSISWPNGEHLSKLRNPAPDVPYHGVSGGLALTGQEDVSQALRGYLKVLSSGQVPCLGVEPLPETSGTTTTDPTLFRYGRIVTAIGTSRATGDRGTDADLRVDTFRLEELV